MENKITKDIAHLEHDCSSTVETEEERVLTMVISNGIFIMGICGRSDYLVDGIFYSPRQYILGPSQNPADPPGSMAHFLAPLPGAPDQVCIPYGCLKYPVGNKDAALVRLYFQVTTPKNGLNG